MIAYLTNEILRNANEIHFIPCDMMSLVILIVGSAMQKIDLRELTCQYPSYIKSGAK